MNQAVEILKESALSSCQDIFIQIAWLQTSLTSNTLTKETNDIVSRLTEEFIAEVKEARSQKPEGRTPPKTKKINIILHVAASLYIFNQAASQLLHQTQPTLPIEEIERTTLLSAIDYITWAESQRNLWW